MRLHPLVRLPLGTIDDVCLSARIVQNPSITAQFAMKLFGLIGRIKSVHRVSAIVEEDFRLRGDNQIVVPQP